MLSLINFLVTPFHLPYLAQAPAPGPEADGVISPDQISVEPGRAWDRVNNWVDGATRMVPNLIVAVIVFAIIWGIACLVKKGIVKQSSRRSRDNLGDVLGGFVKAALIVLGGLIAATIVIPTLKFGDLIAGLGVSSVAIGFAFKDILQNWLAGLLILLNQPFHVRDQIAMGDMEGTVERIETRATIIKTYDGQRIVIPNSDIYTNAVTVRTAHARRRSEYEIGIGYGDDIAKACEVLTAAASGVEGVESDPAPEALPWALDASWVTLRVRWWTDSKRTDVVHVRSRLIPAFKSALDKAGIDLPYQTMVQLLHDQTESQDGIRGEQREGWPAKKGEATVPRWKEEAKLRSSLNEDSMPPAE